MDRKDVESSGVVSRVYTIECIVCFNLSLSFPQSVRKMVERIRAYKLLNQHIFGILNKHLANSDVLAKPVREFQPPIY